MSRRGIHPHRGHCPRSTKHPQPASGSVASSATLAIRSGNNRYPCSVPLGGQFGFQRPPLQPAHIMRVLVLGAHRTCKDYARKFRFYVSCFRHDSPIRVAGKAVTAWNQGCLPRDVTRESRKEICWKFGHLLSRRKIVESGALEGEPGLSWLRDTPSISRRTEKRRARTGATCQPRSPARCLPAG
jgi:hypothetical protein